MSAATTTTSTYLLPYMSSRQYPFHFMTKKKKKLQASESKSTFIMSASSELIL